MPRCWAAPRSTRSRSRPSTASARRASTPRSRASPTRAATASSSSPPAEPNSRPASGIKEMVTGAVALAEFAHVIAAKYPITVALHTDHCPKDKLDTYVRPLLAISAERVAKGAEPAVPVAHVGRLGGADRREPRDRQGTAEAGGRGQDHPRGGDRRRRRRGGRRRGRDQRQALHHGRGLREDHRRARRGRARQVPAGRDVRQRARRVQAGQRQAQARGPQGGPGGGHGQARSGRRAASRSTSSSTAARAR